MDISEAKKRLLAQLKSELSQVIGAGITEVNGIPHILIYLSGDIGNMQQSIPPQYEGYPVKVEITGSINAR